MASLPWYWENWKSTHKIMKLEPYDSPQKLDLSGQKPQFETWNTETAIRNHGHCSTSSRRRTEYSEPTPLGKEIRPELATGTS